TARALEALVAADLVGLRPGQQRYTQLLTETGGIIDDLMVTRPAAREDDGRLLLVVNAARKRVDFAHIAGRLPPTVTLKEEGECALVAPQAPAAGAVMARRAPPAADLAFMTAVRAPIGAITCHISRSGYSGEDGFEIAVAGGDATELARRLLSEEGVLPIGLGARDSLRLEAGLCLYGHDIDESTSPVEAGVAWSIRARRRGRGGVSG